MRKLFVFAVVLGLVSPLSAAPAKPEKGEKKPVDLEAVFKKMDKDGSGSLSLEEFKGKRDAAKAEPQFKKLDKDGNGSISLEEFKAARGKKKADDK